MLVSLVLPPFLVHRMAPAEYSAWVLILQLSNYVYMLDLGMQAAIGKFVAEYDAKGEREASHHLISTSFTILTVTAAIASAAIAVMVCERASAFSPDAGDARTSGAHVTARGWLVYRCHATLRRFSFYVYRFAAVCFSHDRRRRRSCRNRCRINYSASCMAAGGIGPCICGVQSGNGGNAVLWLAKAR